jgi:hypothetical protein
MQISRHWRLNAQRYRLEGFRNAEGKMSLQPQRVMQSEAQIEVAENSKTEKVSVLVP